MGGSATARVSFRKSAKGGQNVRNENREGASIMRQTIHVI